MKFSKRLFLVAGIYGLAIIMPMYFLKDLVARLDPPAITHPEYYYGFLGVAAAWQVMYLVVSLDPARFRPMIPPAVFAKLSFVLAVFVLFALGRASALVAMAVVGDLIFAALFAYAYLLLGRGAGDWKSEVAT